MALYMRGGRIVKRGGGYLSTPPAGGSFQLWSVLYGGATPGDPITVADGVSVIQDMNPTPAHGQITIAATAEVQVVSNTELIATGITQYGLVLGGNTGDYEPTAINGTIVTLNGVPVDSGAPAISNNGVSRGWVIMSGGQRKIRGWAPTYVKSRLNNSATSGSSSLTVADTVGWLSGSRIVVPKPEFISRMQPELHTLSGNSSGTTLSLVGTLASNVFGKLQYIVNTGAAANDFGLSFTPGPFTKAPHVNSPTQVDERPPILHMDRGCTIRCPNDAYWTSDHFGVHNMAMPGAVDQLEGVLVERGGQAGTTGRYPFHVHMDGIDFATNGSETLSSLGSAVTLSPPGGSDLCTITAGLSSALRYTTDGSTPTSSSGLVLAANGLVTLKLSGVTVKIIQEGSGGAAKVAYFVSDGSYTGDTTSFWKKCVSYPSKQRAFVVHGTTGMVAEDCIAYDTNGMQFFTEDGVEKGTIFNRCIGVGAKGAISGRKLKEFEAHNDGTGRTGSSAFWITNPDVTLTFCEGWNCNGQALWMSFSGHDAGNVPEVIFGLSKMSSVVPNEVELGLMEDITCVGNLGLGASLRFVVFNENGDSQEGPAYRPTGNILTQPPFYLTRFTFFKNQGGAYANRAGFPHYVNWIFFANYWRQVSGATDTPPQISQGTGIDTGGQPNLLGCALGWKTLNDEYTEPTGTLPPDAALYQGFHVASYHSTLSLQYSMVFNTKTGTPCHSLIDQYVRPREMGRAFEMGNQYAPGVLRALFPPAEQVVSGSSTHAVVSAYNDYYGDMFPLHSDGSYVERGWAVPDSPFFTEGGTVGPIAYEAGQSAGDTGYILSPDVEMVGIREFYPSFSLEGPYMPNAVTLERRDLVTDVLIASWVIDNANGPPFDGVGRIGRHVSCRENTYTKVVYPDDVPPSLSHQIHLLSGLPSSATGKYWDYSYPLTVSGTISAGYGFNSSVTEPTGRTLTEVMSKAAFIASTTSVYWKDTVNGRLFCRYFDGIAYPYSNPELNYRALDKDVLVQIYAS